MKLVCSKKTLLPSPVGLPRLEVLSLLLVIHLSTQLTNVILLSNLTLIWKWAKSKQKNKSFSTCQLFPVKLFTLNIIPGLRTEIFTIITLYRFLDLNCV